LDGGGEAVVDGRPPEIRHSNPEHGRFVVVDWMLGNTCNFACSYCPAAQHDGSIRWQRPEAVIDFYDRLHEHYVVGQGRRVWLQFTGGEPTVYPGLMRILDAARARGFQASLISNGSRTLRFWDQLVARLDAVILTYHDEFADHARFLEIAGMIARRLPLGVNVTAHPDRFDAILAAAEAIRAACPGAWVSVKPLRKEFGSELYDYTPEQLRTMAGWKGGGREDATVPRGTMTAVMADGTEKRTRANQFILSGTNRWRGYRCAAGLESLRVKGSGQVQRAVCGSGGMLGTLGEAFALPVAPIVCDKERCSCLADILISKRLGIAGH
jgi:organic radical activating enzyme